MDVLSVNGIICNIVFQLCANTDLDRTTEMENQKEHTGRTGGKNMKKNRWLWILVPLLSVLIVFLIVLAVLLITSQNTENRYYKQMEVAEVYMEDMDYENMVQAYETAIELMPEDPDAYIALSEFYLEQGKYFDAISMAEKGLENTGSRRLERLITKIELSRVNMTADQKDVQVDSITHEQENAPQLLIKRNIIGNISEYCYQQYINEYGKSEVKYISEEVGYRVKFQNLSVYAYFKNSPEIGKIIDSVSKKPLPNAKPYKVEVLNPILLFVGFENYISSERLSELFSILPASVLTEIDGSYYLVFEYLGCEFKIETDAEGNIVKSDPVIEMNPLNPVSDWKEEKNEEADKADEDENTVSNNTFVLGGQVYSYDVTEIIISYEVLEDLSPLQNCKNLKSISFYNCKIGDMSPLKNCTALEYLDIDLSYGDLDITYVANLPKLRFLSFHECKEIDDISCLFDKELDILHPCGSSVTIEQCIEYQEKYPDCEVWFDYNYPMFY